ncbi:MAG: undecaprenyl/decaprenyl-phosphate alpha-N-acetylglucosaminyl 1-phosphate transferase [Clostridia bacterium]|nr:undecaprenyl/decaprenyl-phosphate alpha-N-acetylglucosaminyl 1-phosphate transferase [Clostridia bacterium]
MEFSTVMIGILAFICAALISYTITPPVRLLAYRIGAIDVPTYSRRMHFKPMHRIGGLSRFGGFLVSTLVFCDHTPALYAMWIGGGLLVMLGILDDIYRLSALIKLIVQLGSATIAVICFNVRIEFFTLFGKTIELGVWSIPLSILWITALTNAINLIDGLDGLACGVSAITALSIFGVTVIMQDTSNAMLTLIIVASCIGFLPYNMNPARIFMVDTGALFLGYVLSIISISGLFKLHAVLSFFVPLSVFALPLLDTVSAVIRRVSTGHSPFSADREHFHFKLVDMGFTQREAVRLLYGICGLMGLVAITFTEGMFHEARVWKTLVIILTAGAIIVLIFMCMRKPSTRILSGLAEHISEIKLEAQAEAKQEEKERELIEQMKKKEEKKEHKE